MIELYKGIKQGFISIIPNISIGIWKNNYGEKKFEGIEIEVKFLSYFVVFNWWRG